MSIHGITDRITLPRLGKIRLGVKKKSNFGSEYPAEVDYFVVGDEIKAVYGEKPKELDIMFPMNDPEIVFPHYNMWFGREGLKCKGDGQTAIRRFTLVDDKSTIENKPENEYEKVKIPCPCFRLKNPDKTDALNQCSPRGRLMVVLPKINTFGVYQIDVGSVGSLLNINSMIRVLLGQLGGLVGIPLKLKRVPTEMMYNGKKATHYLIHIECYLKQEEVSFLRSNPEPSDVMPVSAEISSPLEIEKSSTLNHWIDSEEGQIQLAKSRKLINELLVRVGKERTISLVRTLLKALNPEYQYGQIHDIRMRAEDLTRFQLAIRKYIISKDYSNQGSVGESTTSRKQAS
jgi:hypothetical protein